MARYRKIRLFSIAIGVFATQRISINAQTATTRQVDSISLSLAMEKDRVLVGQKPLALLRVKNISAGPVGMPPPYRIRIEGKDGEAPERSTIDISMGIFARGMGLNSSPL